MTSDITDTAVSAIIQSFGWLGAAVTDGQTVWLDGHQLAMVSGALVPELNGVFSGTLAPDAAQIAELAGYVADSGLPWAIQLRAAPSAEIAKVAAGYGLTEREEIPLMVRENLAELAGLPRRRADRGPPGRGQRCGHVPGYPVGLLRGRPAAVGYRLQLADPGRGRRRGLPGRA